MVCEISLTYIIRFLSRHVSEYIYPVTYLVTLVAILSLLGCSLFGTDCVTSISFEEEGMLRLSWSNKKEGCVKLLEDISSIPSKSTTLAY